MIVDTVKKRKRMKGRKFRLGATVGKGRKGIQSGRDTLGSSTELEVIFFFLNLWSGSLTTHVILYTFLDA